MTFCKSLNRWGYKSSAQGRSLPIDRLNPYVRLQYFQGIQQLRLYVRLGSGFCPLAFSYISELAML